MTNEEKIQLIGQKIYLLSQNIEKYRTELEQLRQQLDQLKAQMSPGSEQKNMVVTPVAEIKTPVVVPPVATPLVPPAAEEQKITPPVEQYVQPVQQVITPPQYQQQQHFQQQQNIQQAQKKAPAPKKEFHMEEYIGGRVVSIIGISLLVIGLSVGVKYAIDQGYLGELGRIILGFLSGGILMSIALVLRKKYKLFSAIILGGSIAIMFFTSFAGFAFYNLYPREFAFTIMLMLAAFTVFAAHIYDYEVLAVIALVGAYAIPPLLRDDAGKVHIMFTYMAILNGGVLFLSFKKNWNWVTYFAYALTWLIFGAWMLNSYEEERYFTTCFTFLNIFFITFYAMFLAYKVARQELFSVFDVLRIMSNSSVYFGIGYYLLNTESRGDYLGIFCVGNALIHLIVAAVCHRNKNTDKKVMFLILTLVFTFITIAVPVQLEDNWVPLIWFTEMLLLWFMAQRFTIPLYKHMAFVLSILGLGSLLIDWGRFYYTDVEKWGGPTAEIFLNKYFFTTLYSIACLAAVNFMAKRQKPLEENKSQAATFVSYSIFFTVLVAVLSYFGVVSEIHLKFQNLYNNSGTETFEYGYKMMSGRNQAFPLYQGLWILIYTCLYVSALNILNKLLIKSQSLRITAWALNLFTLVACLTVGLFFTGQLKDEYYRNIENHKEATGMMFYSRYVLLPFIILLLVNLFSFKKQEGLGWSRTVNLWLGHAALVVLLSNELTFIFTTYNYGDYDRMLKISLRAGYTILWSLYAMGLIVFGFKAQRKMLRFIAFALVGVTLLKLGVQAFTMTMGYRLLTFTSIGAIMIIVGFLYTKYKHIVLAPDREDEPENKITEEKKNELPHEENKI